MDHKCKLLSDDTPISIEQMKTFDKTGSNSKHLYEDRAYTIILANAAVDLGLYELRVLKKIKAKGIVGQWVIATFPEK